MMTQEEKANINPSKGVDSIFFWYDRHRRDSKTEYVRRSCDDKEDDKAYLNPVNHS